MKTKTSPATLGAIGACSDARDWIKSRRFKSLESAWLNCERGDWMLWYAAKRKVDYKTIVLAACECARLALPYAKGGAARICIETTEAWVRGKATIDDVIKARRAAAAAADAYAADAYAAYAAAAAAAADAADAYAAYAAAAAAAADAARIKTRKQCADIVRKHFPNLP